MLLVTGAGGQVGQHVVREAGHRNIPCLALDHARLDIGDTGAVDAAIAESAPTIRVVINLAAYTRVDDAEAEPDTAFRTNAEGVANLARACVRHDCALLHVSTDYVFDGTLDRPYREDDAVRPPNTYGLSKAAGEEALRSLLPRHLIVRTSWVFGQGGSNFTTTMLRLAARQRRVRVVADEVGCPTPATALAVALVDIAVNMARPGFEAWGTYHLSGRPPVSRADWARAIFAVARRVGGHPVAHVHDIHSHDFPTPARRPGCVVLDCSRISRVLGIEQPEWLPGIDEMLRGTRNSSAPVTDDGRSGGT